MKTLAVSPNPQVIEAIAKTAFQSQLPEMIAAPSIEHALMALSEDAAPFNCIVMDLGIETDAAIRFFSCVRGIANYRKIPIIALAATDQRQQLEAALQAGATDFAAKPVDPLELGTRLRAAEVLATALQEIKSLDPLHRELTDIDELLDLSDEISIDGAKSFVDISELSNHLIQLSAAGLQSSQVVAVRIDQIDLIFARSSPSEFLFALSETADAIAEAFKVFGYLMAYVGRGTFVVVSNKAHLEPSIHVEDEIQSILDERYLQYDDGTALNINVSVGNPVRPTITMKRRITNTVSRAIARAESRSDRKIREARAIDHPLCKFRSFDRW